MRKLLIDVGYTLAALAAVLCIVGFLYFDEPMNPKVSVSPIDPALELHSGYFAEKLTARPLYRLSVIRGGVATIEEFRMKIKQDPILAAHFDGCDLDSLWQHTIVGDQTLFMTFRRKDAIKWNRRPILVKDGEKIIVGCGHAILMRCGNEVNWAPETPSEELPPGTLETPVTENTAPPETIAPPITAESTSTTTSGSTSPVVVGGGFPRGPGGGGFGPPPITPPFRTPEPGTWLMIIVGSILALAVYACGDLRSHFPWR